MANWKVCESCNGKYLPGSGSHPSKCGICAPLKFARAIRERNEAYDAIFGNTPDVDMDNE